MSSGMYGFVRRRVYETDQTLVCKVGDQLCLAVQLMLDRVQDSPKAEEILGFVAKYQFGHAIELFNSSQEHSRVSYGAGDFCAVSSGTTLASTARNTLEQLDGP